MNAGTLGAHRSASRRGASASLHFESWPLDRVVREHNRYAHKPIRIGAKELAQRRINGIFRLDETELLVEMLDGLRRRSRRQRRSVRARRERQC